MHLFENRLKADDVSNATFPLQCFVGTVIFAFFDAFSLLFEFLTKRITKETFDLCVKFFSLYYCNKTMKLADVYGLISEKLFLFCLSISDFFFFLFYIFRLKRKLLSFPLDPEAE